MAAPATTAPLASILAASMVLAVSAQQKPAPKPERKTSTAFTCAADLGSGVASRRRFCDVIVASVAADSVSVSVPPHAGTATLAFDLHNRFMVSASTDPVQSFTRHVAV